MPSWEQIISVAFVLLLIFWIAPRARRALTETRKAEKGEWTGALIPIALVILFVIFLMKSVS